MLRNFKESIAKKHFILRITRKMLALRKFKESIANKHFILI